ncbi:MAG: alpha-L-fucosidase [Planctomycetes bacterium]|nr:alpha-L-fucosidase [Planctomycetota bacterium]
MLTTKKTAADTRWFTHDRFGMFIHWGLYSMAARHEWVRHNEQIPNEVYDGKYFKRFDPDLYDPTAWAKAASAAGMKYFVITTKHHEGFCLWDTKLTDYKSTNTPAKRDLLRPMIDAFRKEGIRVGLYHSLIDWHHPDYVIDPHNGPYREGDRAKLNQGRDQARYAEYLRGQVRELLTVFGDIDILWFDFSYPKEDGSGKGRTDWQSEQLLKMIRELRPDIILNDRIDLPGSWDVKTPEQFQPRAWVTVDGEPVVWEACQTFSGSWGYNRDESSWRSAEQLVHMLIDTVSKGGNLLLNVGPTARGEFDDRALSRLSQVGAWMRRHSRSIYGCTQAPAGCIAPEGSRLTYNAETNRLYIHLLAWPFLPHLHLEGFAGKIEYAQLLNDGSEIRLDKGLEAWMSHDTTAPGLLTVQVPIQKPEVTVPVIELFLKDGAFTG